MKPRPQVPSLPGHWLWGSIAERRRDPLGLFMRQSELGPLSSFRILWIRAYCLNHPDLVKHVFIDNAQNYWKGKTTQLLRPVLGNGLLLAEGETWLQNRRLAQPAFHKERLGALLGMFAQTTGQMLDRWQPHADAGTPFDIAAEMMSVAMSLVAQALFGFDISTHTAGVSEALTFALEEINRRLLAFNLITPRLPTKRKRQFEEAIAVLDRTVYAIIGARRKEGPGKHSDLLAMLMEAQDRDNGEVMSDRQVSDEVMTAFLAGHETTANGLSWLWTLLGQHPEAADRLHREVDAVLQGRPLALDDLGKLEQVTWAFEEAMRLYPPAWFIMRQAKKADVIGGHPIAPGAVVLVSPYVLHRRPEFWERPEAFEPDRFSPQRSVGRPKLAYMPFGAGQRMCIGNNLAMMEAQVILSMVLQRFRVRPVPGQIVDPWPLVTLRPRNGVQVTVESRGARA